MASPKLVEPDRDEGAVHLETTSRVSEESGGRVCFSAVRVVSTQPFAGAHELAQPASCEQASLPAKRVALQRELCGGVEGIYEVWRAEVASALTGRVVIPIAFRKVQLYSPVTVTVTVLSLSTCTVPWNRDAAT